ncbi:MAG TPA: AAA family ATPase [Chloroflexota bacterium]|jgi:predicted ATPase/DNA-binding XRE family transcriptional regulator|nr:AAA family ATPase [Chloroflexota bacterium]
MTIDEQPRAEHPGAFAVLLKRRRSDAGLTQEELAELAQLSPKAVSSLERGARRRPHRVTVALLADALRLEERERAEFEKAARSDGAALPVSASHPAGMPVGAFLGAAPGERIIARRREMDVLEAAMMAVEAGTGRTVLLGGDPGIGKTRLAQEIHGLLRGRGFVAAVGRCYEPRSSVPYFPFLEVMGSLFDTASDAVKLLAPDRWPYLQILLPDRTEFLAGGSGAHDEQILVFRAAAAFVNALARERPVAVMLDDLHWADSSSIQLLHHLARDTRAARVFLLATFRDSDVLSQPALAEARRDLLREALLDQVPVGRFGREETDELISEIMGEQGLSEELGEFVFRRAEGNPYFVRQLVGALAGREEPLSTPDGIGVPDTITSLVVQRMSGLASASKDALSEASVLGQEFLMEDLLAMSDRREADVERGMEEARSAGLVRETGPDGYSFDHGLTQQSLYELLPARTKKRLHIRAGHAIAALEGPERRGRLAELAWHFLQGGDSGQALAWSMEAGSAALAISALAEAEHQYRTAGSLATELDDQQTRAGALEGLGRVFNVSGRYDEAKNTLEEADRLYQATGDATDCGRIAAELAGLYFMGGGVEEGIACVEAALEKLAAGGIEGSRPSPAGELHAVHAQLLWPAGRRAEALAAAQTGAQVAKDTRDMRTQAWCEMQQALMFESLGRRAEALTAAETALSFVERGQDDDLLWYSLSVLTRMYAIRGRLDDAMRAIDRGLVAAERRGDPQYRAASLAELARCLIWTGEWEAADQRLDESETCVDPDDPILGFVGLVRAQLRLWRGDTSELAGDLAAMIEKSDAAGNLDRLTTASLLLAEYEATEGHPGHALQRLEDLGQRQGFNAEDPNFGVCLALSRLALGRAAEARETVERYLTTARRDGLLMPIADLLRLKADALLVLAIDNMNENGAPVGAPVIAKAPGKAKRPRSEGSKSSIGAGNDLTLIEAGTAAGEAVALAKEMRMPFKEAQALVVAGRIKAESTSQDDVSAAKAFIDEAQGIFRGLAATPDIKGCGQGTDSTELTVLE